MLFVASVVELCFFFSCQIVSKLVPLHVNVDCHACFSAPRSFSKYIGYKLSQTDSENENERRM